MLLGSLPKNGQILNVYRNIPLKLPLIKNDFFNAYQKVQQLYQSHAKMSTSRNMKFIAKTFQ